MKRFDLDGYDAGVTEYVGGKYVEYDDAAVMIMHLIDNRRGAEPDVEMENKISEFEANYKAKL